MIYKPCRAFHFTTFEEKWPAGFNLEKILRNLAYELPEVITIGRELSPTTQRWHYHILVEFKENRTYSRDELDGWFGYHPYTIAHNPERWESVDDFLKHEKEYAQKDGDWHEIRPREYMGVLMGLDD